MQQIQAGRFVEMRELLNDNIALHDQLEAVQGQTTFIALPASLRTRQREVSSLESWMYCFTAYMAVRTTDTFTRDMLAYCRLLIYQAMRHGGRGWIEYDRTFRRQCEIDSNLQWNGLLADLQASTILGQRQSNGTFCSLCREADHTNAQCALYSLEHAPPSAGTWSSQQRRPQQPPRRAGQFVPICASWNMGPCIYPSSCTYKHVCATCFGKHKSKDCPDAPSDNPSRQPIARRNQAPAGQKP